MTAVWLPGGVYTEFLVTSEQAEGRFCVFRDHPPVGWRMPPHLHSGETETIHVLEGEFGFELDGVAAAYGPGDTLHVPAGVMHSGEVVGERPGRRLIIFSPGGMDGLFQRIGTGRAEESIDLAQALALARDHGWRFAGDSG